MATEEEIRNALSRDLTIDIITTGRKSGRPRRTEIWFHRVGSRVIITGTPGRRDWYANLVAHARFTFHLKESVEADLAARAVPVTDRDEKRRMLLSAESIWRRPSGAALDEWVDRSPMVEVLFEDLNPSGLGSRTS